MLCVCVCVFLLKISACIWIKENSGKTEAVVIYWNQSHWEIEVCFLSFFLVTWMKSNLNYNLAYHSPYFFTEKSQYHPTIKESTKLGKSCYFTIEVLSICFNLILSSFNFVLLFTLLLTNVFSGPCKFKRDRQCLIGDKEKPFLSKKEKKRKKKESFLWRRVAKFPITLTFSYNLIE